MCYPLSTTRERSVNLKTINTAELFESLKSFCNFMVSRKLLVISSATVYLFHCRNLSQYFKKLYESVSIRKGNLKFCNVTCTKDLHQIPKDQISVAESLKLQRQI